MTVTYSVCIGGAGIDYSSVASILYTYSAFSSSCGFTPVGWGYAGPALGLGLPRCQLRVSDIAVTDSARFCGGGFDSFLGFEYVVCSDRILTCRIKSICSPAKGGTGCYRFNYQPGS